MTIPFRLLRILALIRRMPPAGLRARVRGSELWLIALAVAIGALSGVAVSLMSLTAQLMHEWMFGLPEDMRLSGTPVLASRWLLLLPAVGGVVLAGLVYLTARVGRMGAVDAIEANALHGGRMSLRDSVIVSVQNVISNGFGASVGLEAGYTQMASAIGSRLASAFQLRRSDVRTLVGCGAAAAIATAFDAPLSGAFYAFELVIGTYSIATLAPVAAAALAGTVTGQWLVGPSFPISVGEIDHIRNLDYVAILVLGIVCAGVGIAIMRGVTLVETVARNSPLPEGLRPVLGGLVVGGLAFVSPQVLSAGHGALHLNLADAVPVGTLALILVLKSLASAVSIGSGFRGGLFFASLFLGALVGKLFAAGVPLLVPGASLSPVVYGVVGMSGLAVAIVGGPLTMTFLALELTGDFPLTVLVLLAVVASALTVRKTFGYSFATWRFHLRGETIRSAHDVGWLRELTVGRMMRPDVRTVPDTTTLAQLRSAFPLGSTQRVVLVDVEGRYAGIVLIAEAHAALDEDATPLADLAALVRSRDAMLKPQMNARDAMAEFDRTESEELAVVNDPSRRKVLGLLTESHVLRRYSEELEQRRREAVGDLSL